MLFEPLWPIAALYISKGEFHDLFFRVPKTHVRSVYKNLTVLLVFILFIPIAFCQNQTIPSKDYQHRIEKFLEHNFVNNHVGLIVQSLTDNKILYQHNEHKLFVPASLLKLFTLAASLKELTPNFKFTTSLKWDPKSFKNQYLTGDLALIFSGDPSLKQHDLEELMNALKKQNINNIKGDLIIDDTLFSDFYGDGWSNEDLVWYFAAPSGAIVIAENKIPVSIKPINTLSQSVEFFLNDEYKALYPLVINSNVTAVTKQQSDTDCRLGIKANSENEIFFSGCAQIDPSTQQINLALYSPRKYLQNWLIDYLQKNNIKLHGKIIFGKAPEFLSNLNTHDSLPLFNLLKTMMKDSNNVYAHSIGKTLGVKLYGEGSFKTATKAMLSILQKKFTINTSTLRIVDSSGLSVYNVVSPSHVIRLLQAIYNDKAFKEKVLKILPNSGQNGSLKNRLAAHDLKGKIFAKTGSLTNASGLAGFTVTKTGQPIAFVFMVNNLVQNSSQVKQLEDELCELLVNSTSL